MTDMNPAYGNPAELRKYAEQKVGAKTVDITITHSPEEIGRMLHELQVHQVELEMQNEELRRTQEELQIARDKYFDLYDLAPAGYLTLNENGQVLEANLVAATLLGTDRNQLVGRPLAMFILNEDQDLYYLHRKKLFATGLPQKCDLRMAGQNGIPLWMHLEATVTKKDDVPTCRIVMTDISERKRAEEEHLKYELQLQRNQKLESLGLLAGGIAHDFNNLMGGIFGYIDLAIGESKDGRVVEHLSKAMNTIGRARGLTGQLLTFAIGGDPVRQAGHLFPFVQETARFALSGANVTCRFDAPQDLWACNFDKSQIGQVINNLAINAWQAMPHGGTIEIIAQNIVFAEKEHPILAKGKYVRIIVRDTGIGIPEEIVGRIFDPFFTTKTKGHGLGLATCYSIVKRHDGWIDVESEPDKGSTFKVYLPAIAELIVVAGSARSFEATHTGRGTFLVMDDEEVVRDTVGCMLEAFGYTVVYKENGKDAIDFFIAETGANRKIMAMILDLTVSGGMGGKEAIEEIRKAGSKTPAFVTSGYTDDPVMANPEKYGFTASIGKPFTKSELSEMLNKCLEENL